MSKQLRQAHLFIDVSLMSDKSHQIVDFLDKNIKSLNFNGWLIEAVPVMTDKDKAVLIENGVKKMPALLFQKQTIIGVGNIINYLGRSSKPKPRKKSADEMLREEQMADMDIEKFENGEYDDEDNFDDEEVFRGDPDAVNQNLQRKMAEFNQRRTGRTEEDENAPKKRKSRKKKGRRQPPPDDDMYDDNIAPPPRGGRGGGGGGGGGARRGKGGGVEVNPEDWDAETQALLDKGGADW